MVDMGEYWSMVNSWEIKRINDDFKDIIWDIHGI
jgi:hypothetical protein